MTLKLIFFWAKYSFFALQIFDKFDKIKHDHVVCHKNSQQVVINGSKVTRQFFHNVFLVTPLLDLWFQLLTVRFAIFHHVVFYEFKETGIVIRISWFV